MSYSKRLLSFGLLSILGLLAFIPAAVHANTLLEPDVFYGIQFTGSCPTPLDKWDPSTDTHTSYSLTSPTTFCNGRGLAWDGTDLWYSVVSGTCPADFRGDGLIHKVGPTGGADISTIPDPYGLCGRGIGALDFDGSGHLWTVSYLPTLDGVVVPGFSCSPSTNCRVEISELDPGTGTVLASCEALFRGGGEGSDTFAIFSNNQFATDGGEILTTLFFYLQPTLGAFGGNCTQVSSTTINGATGLDFASNGDCIYTDGGDKVWNGGNSCSTATQKAGPITGVFPAEEDLTCTCNFLPPPPVIVGAPEFGLPVVLMAAVMFLALATIRRFRARNFGTTSL